MDQYEIERIYDLCKFAEAVVKRFSTKILKCSEIIPKIYFEFIPWDDCTAYEKYYTIFINIGNVQQYLGELFYSDLAYIRIMSIVIHELFHMEQNVDQEKYNKDEEYYNMVEEDVNKATDLFMSRYLQYFSDSLGLSAHDIAFAYRLVEYRSMKGFFTEPKFVIERFDRLRDIYIHWFSKFLTDENFKKVADNWDRCNTVLFSTITVVNPRDENEILTEISPLIVLKEDDTVYYHDIIFDIFVDADGKSTINDSTNYYSRVVIQDKRMDIYIIKNLSSINRKIGFITE